MDKKFDIKKVETPNPEIKIKAPAGWQREIARRQTAMDVLSNLVQLIDKEISSKEFINFLSGQILQTMGDTDQTSSGVISEAINLLGGESIILELPQRENDSHTQQQLPDEVRREKDKILVRFSRSRERQNKKLDYFTISVSFSTDKKKINLVWDRIEKECDYAMQMRDVEVDIQQNLRKRDR